MKPSSNVPSFLTRDLTEEDRTRFEEIYKSSRWVLEKMRERLEGTYSSLVTASEAPLPYEEMIFNAAERKAIRNLISYLPK